MNLQHLKELDIIIKTGSLSAAAPELGYTLSALSRSVSTLEKEFGFQLLHRSKKGIQPTKECEKILPYIQELLLAENHLTQEINSINGVEEGVISIGSAYRHYYRWLSEMTRQFHALHPGITFQIYNGFSSQFIQQIHQHEIDFCLISQREGNHQWFEICKDPLMSLIPKNHPLSKQKKISIHSFETEPYIETCPGQNNDNDRFLTKYDIHPNIQFSTMDIQATYAMVDANMGIGINNQIDCLHHLDGVCHRKIEPEEQVEIGLACDTNLSPLQQAFLDFILPQLPN